MKLRIKNTLLIILGLILVHLVHAQDTLSGNYTNYKLLAGKYVIQDVVGFKGLLTIEPGVVIELVNNGRIICEGGIFAKGVAHNIQFIGKPFNAGIGLVIKNIDSSSIDLSNITFKNLQLPLLFDFGWKRNSVNITDNMFIGNIGKVSIIQVLNQPFTFSFDTSSTKFVLTHNLFAGNNAPIYFEDFKSDHVSIQITNNAFVNNRVYGFKNYNIATNILYGRADQNATKFNAVIEVNSFVSNYLIDNYTDSIVHEANFGIYGSEKNFSIKTNYFGSAFTDGIKNTIHDQSLNYSAPKANFDPFLITPSSLNPTHIFQILNLDNQIIADTQFFSIPLNGMILKSNNPVNYNQANVLLTSLKDDSTITMIKDTLNYKVDVMNNRAQLKFDLPTKPTGYFKMYSITNLFDLQGNYVPDVYLGYDHFQNELKKRKPAVVVTIKNLIDSVIKKPIDLDSLKNIQQKIHQSIKSRFEIGLFGGGAIFLGTISNSNYFKNDINMYNSFLINYKLYSNLSFNLNIASFKLGNTDYKADNNDQIARGMNFETTVLSVSPSIDYDFVDNRLDTKARKLKPSIGLGVDVLSFNPTSIYKGAVYNLQPLGTGGQLLDSTKGAYSLLAQAVFVDFKLRYQFSRHNSIGLHFSYHKSMSDYLDDVGPDAYPNATFLYNNTKLNPDAAVYFSNPTSRPISHGQMRNSPSASSDAYILFGFFYSRKF